MPDDKLSRLASAVLAELRGLNESLEEIHLFGAPSECCALSIRSAEQRVRDLCAAQGYTVNQFVDAVAERTCDRWVYESGLSAFCDL